MSTSSPRSIGEETRNCGKAVQASRRATTVRFAPPPLSSAVAAPAKAMVRPATASGARPGSASGQRCGTSAGRLPEPGAKAMRRSWGWTGDVDAKEKGGNPVAAKVVAKAQSRSSSVSSHSISNISLVCWMSDSDIQTKISVVFAL